MPSKASAKTLSLRVPWVCGPCPRRPPCASAWTPTQPTAQWVQLREGKRQCMWEESLQITPEVEGDEQACQKVRRILRLTERTIDTRGRPLLPPLAVPARASETLRDQLDRLAALAAKQAAAAKLEARLNAEKQFNRKVEINAQLRTIRTELEALT